MPQARELRKDEPHPVGSLPSFGKLLRGLLIDVRLGVQETNEVSISHRHAPIGSSVDAVEEPYARSGWAMSNYAVWIFRRLNYGFAQA